MRWLAVVLILANLLYLGWELRRDRQVAAYNQALRTAVQVRPVPAVDDEPQPAESDAPPDPPPPARDTPGLPVEAAETARSEVEMMTLESLDAVEPGPEQWSDCLVAGPFPGVEQVLDWSKRLSVLSVLTRLRRHPPEESRQYLLYLGPIESLEQLLETTQNLEKDGVLEYRVMNQGKLRNSISLGIYQEHRVAALKLEEFLEMDYPVLMTPYLDELQYWFEMPRSTELPEAVHTELQAVGLRFGACDSSAAPGAAVPSARGYTGWVRARNSPPGAPSEAVFAGPGS